MKIAIHHREGSFSTHWIEYCTINNIPFKIVNCYDSNILSQIRECDALMWHYSHMDYKDQLISKELVRSLEQSGTVVFPNSNTGWHFDDKIGQKYLLESICAPLIPSFVFYDSLSAKKWIMNASFPKVFKLRGGAGATNVKLVRSKSQALSVVKKAFGRGFYRYNRREAVNDALKKITFNYHSILRFFKAVARLIFPSDLVKYSTKEKGYVYFQEFMPNNNFDIRLIVIGKRAYGMKRLNRKNDFRASGSGNYDYSSLPAEVVKLGFDVSEKLKLQCAAFDFIYDTNGHPVIVELSYGFGTTGSSRCDGYWDSTLTFNKGPFNPFGWMVDDLIADLYQSLKLK